MLLALAALCFAHGPRAQADDLAGLVRLPPVVSPGEELELTVLDPKRAPSGGRWRIGGALAREEGGRLRVTLPASLKPGSPLAVSYHDPRGAKIVDVEAAAGVRVAAAPPLSLRPRITGCASRAAVAETLCVCGSFSPASWDGITLDGRPLHDRVSASRRVVFLRLPPDLAPGAHVVAGNPSFGFAMSDQMLFVALRVLGRLDREAVLRGQATSLSLEVWGTEDALPFVLRNHTPAIVSLDGGEQQTVPTSGGQPNRLERRVRGLRRGDFDIGYTLDLPCRCAAEEGSAALSPEPVPFLPGRVLALVAMAPALAVLARELAAAHGLSLVASHPLSSTGEALLVFAGPHAAVLDKAEALRKDPRVRVSQPDYLHETTALTPADVRSPADYARRLIGADALPPGSTAEGVTLALIDTAVDGTHPALRDRLSLHVDLTGEGWAPEVHGTALAGLIVAQPGTGAMEGLAPGVRLLAVKACHPVVREAVHARCPSSALARGVDLALENGASILNLSVAGPEDPLLGRMIDQAVRAGRLVVSAAGHRTAGTPPPFPGTKDNVLTVTAVDARGALYRPASRGAFVDLAAPGVELLSTVPGKQYAVLSGTSLAAALVSASAAVLLQRAGAARSAYAIRSDLEGAARDLGSPGRDPEFGNGLLDVAAAVGRTRAPGGP